MQKKSKHRFIFVTGGVLSSIGKGLSAASIAAVLQASGFKVRLKKIDPYLNVDPGTMNPQQHGEVYVTDGGLETDLDLGHYERFTGVPSIEYSSITTGKIYTQLLKKERRGDFLGNTIQVVPHFTNEVKNFIFAGLTDEDFVICEIGGTVGDIESPALFETIRQMKLEVVPRPMSIHLTYLPYIATAGELKTKPTQHSVAELQRAGIHTDMLLCRSSHPLDKAAREKISLFCNVPFDRVIPLMDVSVIEEVPLVLYDYQVHKHICDYFGITKRIRPNMKAWEDFVTRSKSLKNEVSIGLIVKYAEMKDTYKSVSEALRYAGVHNNVKVNTVWIDAEKLEETPPAQMLKGLDGILVPGGFGKRGVQGKIKAITYAREHKIPFFGICLGMQLSVIEAARNLAGLKGADSKEFDPKAKDPTVILLEEWKTLHGTQKASEMLGGTMRLGKYTARLKPNSLAHKIYGETQIDERHRHRYEVNSSYLKVLEKAGLSCTGFSIDGQLPEIIERKDHPFFIAVQFHPEFKARPFASHPIFEAFVAKASSKNKGKK